MITHEHGYWIGTTNGEHFFDSSLAEALVRILHGQNVLDVGCGLGDYVKTFRHNGIEAAGVDGNPATPYLTRWQCCIADLAEPWEKSLPWENVLCLEVLEHLPAKYEQIALENLTDYCSKRLVLSWAQPGQSGNGHVNCRPPNYILARMADFCFALNRVTTDALRGAAELEWFRNNVMVFERC